MESVALASHLGAQVAVDVCGPCHVIWFDHMESTSLSPGSVIDLFKRIHAAREGGRNLLKIMVACPHCAAVLKSTTDLAKGGRFTYSRCVNGHGRLTSFAQFLREKNFVRSLQPHEIFSLSVKVKQIRCSSCGGPVNLETDKACTHCGSAISVLDEAAVEKALLVLHDREVQRTTRDPARMNEALRATETSARHARLQQGFSQPQGGAVDWLNVSASAVPLADLVDLGISAVLAALRDN